MNVTVRIKTTHGQPYAYDCSATSLSFGAAIDGEWREFTIEAQLADRLLFERTLLLEEVAPLKATDAAAAFLKPL
jgi:hypothetical protein